MIDHPKPTGAGTVQASRRLCRQLKRRPDRNILLFNIKEITWKDTHLWNRRCRTRHLS